MTQCVSFTDETSAKICLKQQAALKAKMLLTENASKDISGKEATRNPCQTTRWRLWGLFPQGWGHGGPTTGVAFLRKHLSLTCAWDIRDNWCIAIVNILQMLSDKSFNSTLLILGKPANVLSIESVLPINPKTERQQKYVRMKCRWTNYRLIT